MLLRLARMVPHMAAAFAAPVTVETTIFLTFDGHLDCRVGGGGQGAQRPL